MKSYDTIMHISLHTQVSDIQLINIIYAHILFLNIPWYPLAHYHTETKQLSCWNFFRHSMLLQSYALGHIYCTLNFDMLDFMLLYHQLYATNNVAPHSN